MKQLSIIAILLLSGSFATNAQTVKNSVSCDISVTAICYDRNSNCVPTLGNSLTVAAGSSATPPPGCTSALETVVGYRVCWDSHLCPPPNTICTEIDAYAAGANPFMACGGVNPPAWTFLNVNSTLLDPCSDCVQPGGHVPATVKIDPTTGDITITP